MPYSSTARLPASVRNTLPKHAQAIYRKAFENAWGEYKDADKRRGRASREEAAHKVAWSAVKTKYKKNGEGKWSTRGDSTGAAKTSRKSGTKTKAAKSASTGGRKSTRKAPAKAAGASKKTSVKSRQTRWKTASGQQAKSAQGSRGKNAASRSNGAGQSPATVKRRQSRKVQASSAETASSGQQPQPEHVMSQQPPERASMEDIGQAS